MKTVIKLLIALVLMSAGFFIADYIHGESIHFGAKVMIALGAAPFFCIAYTTEI